MLSYDPEKAAEVWKRVQGQQAAGLEPAGLLQMITEEWTDAVTYLHLSRQFRGGQSAALRRMAEQEQSHAACLKGIYTLHAGLYPKRHMPPAPKGDTKTLLRHCYNREMRGLTQYQAHISDPEYGQVFARLAAQEQEHCQTLLQLLGSLQPE